MIEKTRFLYRGVTESFHKRNEGRLYRKTIAPFRYAFHWGEGATWGSGITWGASEANAVIRHQLNQEGFPTSGISTTPHFERAKVYARGTVAKSSGYVYKIDRTHLSSYGVREFVVANYAKAPSMPEDEEVILVTADNGPLPEQLIVKVIPVNSCE